MQLTQRSKSMSNSQSSATSDEINIVTNPLREPGVGQGQPSEAFMASFRRSRDSLQHGEDDSAERKPGWRTIITAVVFLVAGLAMFLTGAVLYWTDKGDGKRTEGLDVLIVGSIMLLPGAYACVTLYGAWRKWRGYRFDSIPFLD